MKEKEIWKRLIYRGNDYGDFYEVSNYGEIRNSKTHKIRLKNINHNGYYVVNCSLGSRKSKIVFRVHKAVAETFIENPDKLPVVNHKDGNKTNNQVCNLEWCTYSDNSKHAYDNNLTTIKYGEENNSSKLNDDIVKYIRDNYIPYDREFGTRGLSRKFNVNHSTIMSVLKYETWCN